MPYLSHNANLRAHKPKGRQAGRRSDRRLQVQLATPPPPPPPRPLSGPVVSQLLLAKLDLAATTGLDVLQNQGTALAASEGASADDDATQELSWNRSRQGMLCLK